METEKLSFKFLLCPKILDSKNKIPEFKIFINQQLYHHSIDKGSRSINDIITVEFNAELNFGLQNLELHFLNKDSNLDTLSKNNHIYDDLYIQIHGIEIDGIDITSILNKLAIYELYQPVEINGKIESKFINHRFLSWNGVYRLPFETPFYKWLLDQF